MVETESFFITKLDHETMKLVSKPNARLSYKEYDNLINIYREMSPGVEKFKLLMIFQEGYSLERNPLDFVKNKMDMSYRKAEAFIVISPIFRTFIKMGMKMKKRKHPMRLFDNESEAEKWILEQ